MIHVIATVEVKPGARGRFLEEFSRVLADVRAEPGCIEYGAAVEVDAGLPRQSPPRPDAVLIVEKWSDLERLRDHLGSPHMQAYREAVKDLVEKVSLAILEPAGEV